MREAWREAAAGRVLARWALRAGGEATTLTARAAVTSTSPPAAACLGKEGTRRAALAVVQATVKCLEGAVEDTIHKALSARRYTTSPGRDMRQAGSSRTSLDSSSTGRAAKEVTNEQQQSSTGS
mmetsp:Transcript_14349/g.27562  ORF Transcript_14349/g.27562 Transcript_14349/m.27562 type:complete len:124 (-) Transcript_14349:475-846(-)